MYFGFFGRTTFFSTGFGKRDVQRAHTQPTMDFPISVLPQLVQYFFETSFAMVMLCLRAI